MAAKYSKNDTITELYHRHQLELIFEKDIDEVEFMRFCAKIGSIVSIIKDEFYGPLKYIVSFSNILKLKRFEIEIVHRYKNVKIGPPKFPIRMSRLEKNFSFPALLDNLAIFEREIDKMQEGTHKNVNN